MIEVVLLNLKNNERFSKFFYNHYAKNNFVRKCKYNSKVKVLAILDNSKFYD